MENEIYIKTAKIIYENEGDCRTIDYCNDCPFDNLCNFLTTNKDKFKFAKEFLEEQKAELPIVEEEMDEIEIKGIKISCRKDKDIEVTTKNNIITIKILED